MALADAVASAVAAWTLDGSLVSDVLPMSFTDDPANCCATDVELVRKTIFRDTFCMQQSNTANLLSSQFSASVLLSAQISPTSFYVSIDGVVGVSSKEQMRRIATRAVVAPMEYAKGRRPFIIREKVCDDMRSSDFVSNGELPISVFIDVAQIGPAFVWFSNSNFGPKAIIVLGKKFRSGRIASSHFGLQLGRGGQNLPSANNTREIRSLYPISQLRGRL